MIRHLAPCRLNLEKFTASPEEGRSEGQDTVIFDFEVGDFVRHPARPDWGDGQVQSIIGRVVTVTFEEFGKQVIHSEHVTLELVAEKTEQARNR